MTQVSAALHPRCVTLSAAREELAKFFAIAAMAEEAPGMFSAYIDAEWHRFASSDGYPAFCEQAAGRRVTHDGTCGEGAVAWVELYHQAYGALPAVWFADDDGVVDDGAYARYVDTRTVHGSWNCTATTNDGD
jgi:hypothetical protein